METEQTPLIDDETPQVQFYILKSVPFHIRAIAIMILVIIGAALQAFLPLPFAYLGLACFFAIGLLMMTRGCSNAPATRYALEEGQWKKAPLAKLQEIKELQKKTKSWDSDLLDISNAAGFMIFVLIGAAVGIPVFIYSTVFLPAYIPLFVGSLCCIFLPIWFTGMRRGYTDNKLAQKIDTLGTVAAAFEALKENDESIEVMLQLEDVGETSIPRDLKLQLSWPSASNDFYGVQCQVNLNNVQGKLYPYCYFVAVMKRNMRFPDSVGHLAEPYNITVESEVQSDVKVLIIRGYTTKTSGYHTGAAQIYNLLRKAIIAGRSIAEKYPK